jgi:hypothetical protein
VLAVLLGNPAFAFDHINHVDLAFARDDVNQSVFAAHHTIES